MSFPVENKSDEIAALCRRFGVSRLELFGSATSGEFDWTESDLDFIVQFEDKSAGYANRYLGFAEALERMFDRPVDLITERSVSNPYFRQSAQATRKVVYDRARDKATP